MRLVFGVRPSRVSSVRLRFEGSYASVCRGMLRISLHVCEKLLVYKGQILGPLENKEPGVRGSKHDPLHSQRKLDDHISLSPWQHMNSSEHMMVTPHLKISHNPA